jgi:hypothetical protein
MVGLRLEESLVSSFCGIPGGFVTLYFKFWYADVVYGLDVVLW